MFKLYSSLEHDLYSESIDPNSEYEMALKAINLFRKDIFNKTRLFSDIDLELVKSQVIFEEDITQTRNNNDSIILFTFKMREDNKVGFTIACANRDNGYVLAYAEEGSLCDTVMNGGLKIILDSYPLVAKNLMIKSNKTRNEPESPYEPGGYWEEREEWSYYLKTTWSQFEPYNYALPSSKCSDGYNLTGCGTIALAQIIAHFKKYKETYNFNDLTNQPTIYAHSSNYLINQVSSFIKSVGTGCKTTFRCYEDGGSPANLNNAYNFLKSLGYKVTSQSTDFNILTFCDVIHNGGLAILKGEDVRGLGGHMWVVDGAQIGTRTLIGHLHCNWGYGGFADGWYYIGNDVFTIPTDTGYEFKNKMHHVFVSLN